MKASILVATALAGSVIGQGVLPNCAQSCVIQFTSGSSIGGCSSLDVACICSNSSFLSNIACCLAGVCSPEDQVAATNYAKNICKTGGVTNLPNAVSCLTGTAAQTSSTGSHSSTSSAAVQTTSAQTGTTVSSSSSAPSTTSTTANTASPASASSSHSTTSTPNAGQQNVAGMGAGILGGLAAAVALL